MINLRYLVNQTHDVLTIIRCAKRLMLTSFKCQRNAFRVQAVERFLRAAMHPRVKLLWPLAEYIQEANLYSHATVDGLNSLQCADVSSRICPVTPNIHSDIVGSVPLRSFPSATPHPYTVPLNNACDLSVRLSVRPILLTQTVHFKALVATEH